MLRRSKENEIKPRVFVTSIGQEDNLGDSVLRRGLLDSLDRSHVEVHVLVGSNSTSYISALGLKSDDVIYESRRAWRRSLMLSAFRGKCSLVFNAGEVRVDRAHSHLGRFQTIAVAIIRLRGGAAIHTGVGIRDPAEPRDFAARCVLRMCNLVTWRDGKSRDWSGIGQVLPDWAFALGPQKVATDNTDLSLSRSFLAISMRGDRDFPSEDWFGAVRTILDENGLTPILVTQVVRDGDRSRAIARELGDGTKVVGWAGDTSHAVHETQVRDIYRNSTAVVSDRLHALVLGATEGAVPLPLTVGSSEKLRRTLAVVGLDGFCIEQDEIPHYAIGNVARDALARGTQVQVDEARERLTILCDTIVTHVAGGSGR
ncbi:polysaccharide pyruvyl transferase family protein [Rhodococcus sp. NPDC056743]|uniref:polysaccharide pyruvyl transferase family protein n=1 Tax=Rhodococcus sp. NPDC056743 TaxID=3345934 RepID=UPI003671C464